MLRLFANQLRHSSNVNPLILQPVTVDQKSVIITFLHKYLFFDEPLFKSTNALQSPTQLDEDWINLVSAFMELRNVYKYEENGSLAGVWIHSKRVRDSYSRKTFTDKIQFKNPRIGEMFELFEFIEQKADVHNYAKQDKLLFHECIGIHSDYRDKGLLKFLLWYSEKLAIAKGYRLMATISTNAYFTRCCLGLGWQDVFTLKYDNYKRDGMNIFNVPKPHTEIGYYIKYL